MSKTSINDDFVENLINNNHLDEKGNPTTKEGKALLELALLSSESDIEGGYESNQGRGRCIKSDDKSFDYLKMSNLYHSGRW